MDYKLVTIVLKNSVRVTGKLYTCLGKAEYIELEDAIEQFIILVPQGGAVSSFFVGKARFKEEDVIITMEIESKSTFWQNYFQTISNIEIRNKLV